MIVWCLVVLAAISCTSAQHHIKPKVQVYTSLPGEFGKENTLICRVSGFHPPDITVQLMKDGVELPNPRQSDLAFKQDWRFHLTTNVAFTPQNGEKYHCKVNHGGTIRDYAWEPNM